MNRSRAYVGGAPLMHTVTANTRARQLEHAAIARGVDVNVDVSANAKATGGAMGWSFGVVYWSYYVRICKGF